MVHVGGLQVEEVKEGRDFLILLNLIMLCDFCAFCAFVTTFFCLILLELIMLCDYVTRGYGAHPPLTIAASVERRRRSAGGGAAAGRPGPQGGGQGQPGEPEDFFLIVGGLYSVTAWRENDQEGHSVY